jgi:Cu+-exporting ATPase
MSDMVKDLVCGMDVSIDSEHNIKYNDKSYYFCSEHCLEKFKQGPSEYINQKSDEKGGCCGDKNH